MPVHIQAEHLTVTKQPGLTVNNPLAPTLKGYSKQLNSVLDFRNPPLRLWSLTLISFQRSPFCTGVLPQTRGFLFICMCLSAYCHVNFLNKTVFYYAALHVSTLAHLPRSYPPRVSVLHITGILKIPV